MCPIHCYLPYLFLFAISITEFCFIRLNLEFPPFYRALVVQQAEVARWNVLCCGKLHCWHLLTRHANQFGHPLVTTVADRCPLKGSITAIVWSL